VTAAARIGAGVRLGPVGLAASLSALAALAWLIWDPPSLDLAAHLYRADLFERTGLTLYDGGWYAGHHALGYSVLFPPLGAWLGPQLAGAIGAVGVAAAGAALLERGPGTRLAAAWLGLGTASMLLSGRLPFALGLAIAAASALALARRRTALAVLAAFVSAFVSPVAALFAALAGLAAAAGDPSRRRPGIAVALAALIPVVLLAVFFPEGGTEPFVVSAWLPVPVACAAIWAWAGPERPVLRWACVLYAAGATLAFVLPTPVGGNAVRLGALVSGPVAAMLLWPDRRALLLVAAPFLLYWQWTAAVRDVVVASGDRAVEASYYRPLLGFLDAQPGPKRVEVPFTKVHWEAFHLARHVPIARGWQRQLDRDVNALFYEGTLTPARYQRWLRDTAVRFVALPDVALDDSAKTEARIVRSRPPFLREAFRGGGWAVYEVRDATPLVSGPGRLTSFGPDAFTLRADRPGRFIVRLRHTPWWTVTDGRGCAGEAPGGWTLVRADAPGELRVAARLRAGDAGRCAD
jgi:hypothetical protein